MKQLLALSAVLIFISGVLLASALDAEAKTPWRRPLLRKQTRLPAVRPQVGPTNSKYPEPEHAAGRINRRRHTQARPRRPHGRAAHGWAHRLHVLWRRLPGFQPSGLRHPRRAGLLLFRFFAGRSAQQRGPRGERDGKHDGRDKPIDPKEASEAYRRAAETWGMLRSKPGENSKASPPLLPGPSRANSLTMLPGFPRISIPKIS